MVREMYMCWFGLIWCLSWNFICASIILGTDAKDKVASWFLTVIYWLTGIPIAFYMWYLAIYRAAKNDSAARYLFFFISFIIHIGFCIWAAIGRDEEMCAVCAGVCVCVSRSLHLWRPI